MQWNWAILRAQFCEFCYMYTVLYSLPQWSFRILPSPESSLKPLCSPFLNYCHSRQSLICSNDKRFDFSKISYKCDHIVYSLFCLACFKSEWWFWDSSKLHLSVVLSILLLSSIPFYGCTKICLSIHYQLANIWVVSRFGLWWTMLLWTFVYKSLCRHMFSYLLDGYLAVGLLGHMLGIRLTF